MDAVTFPSATSGESELVQPVSAYAGALGIYAEAKRAEAAILSSRDPHLVDDACGRTLLALHELLVTRSPDLRALTQKVAAVMSEFVDPDGRGHIEADEAALLLADLKQLAGA